MVRLITIEICAVAEEKAQLPKSVLSLEHARGTGQRNEVNDWILRVFACL